MAIFFGYAVKSSFKGISIWASCCLLQKPSGIFSRSHHRKGAGVPCRGRFSGALNSTFDITLEVGRASLICAVSVHGEVSESRAGGDETAPSPGTPPAGPMSRLHSVEPPGV